MYMFGRYSSTIILIPNHMLLTVLKKILTFSIKLYDRMCSNRKRKENNKRKDCKFRFDPDPTKMTFYLQATHIDACYSKHVMNIILRCRQPFSTCIDLWKRTSSPNTSDRNENAFHFCLQPRSHVLRKYLNWMFTRHRVVCVDRLMKL